MKEQLAIGGRVVIPVGEEERYQTLTGLDRVLAHAEDDWDS